MRFGKLMVGPGILVVGMLVSLCGILEAKKSVGSAAETQAASQQPSSDSVRRGLAWLVRTQHENGGWSQGEESLTMGQGMGNLRDKPNVADTCMATLALMRAGSTPSSGEYARPIRRGIDFIMTEVESSDRESLYVTGVRGTRVQSKLGPYIDTFLTGLVLAEVKGKINDEAGNRRLIATLDKVMDKIERNQRQDGTWSGDGWAPVLSQAMAAKAVNRGLGSVRRHEPRLRRTRASSSTKSQAASREEARPAWTFTPAPGILVRCRIRMTRTAGKNGICRKGFRTPGTNRSGKMPATPSHASRRIERTWPRPSRPWSRS